MNAGINTTRDLLVTAIDLTRASCAHENYLTWLSMYRGALSGSADIAKYFASAAIAFEEQSHHGALCRARGETDEIEGEAPSVNVYTWPALVQLAV
jgi:hypothetical protein